MCNRLPTPPTSSATPTLTPSPTLSTSPTPAVTLSLRAAPAFVIPSGVLILFWQIDNFSGGLEGLDLLFTVPPGITPIDLKSSIMTSGSAAPLLPVTELQGKARFRVAEQAEGSFPLQVCLLQDWMLLASATLTLTEEGLLLIPPQRR